MYKSIKFQKKTTSLKNNSYRNWNCNALYCNSKLS